MRERGIYPQDCPRTVRSRRNRCGNTELACSPKYHGAKTAYWAVGRQPGSYPETGLGEIDGDVLEADFWPGITSALLGIRPKTQAAKNPKDSGSSVNSDRSDDERPFGLNLVHS